MAELVPVVDAQETIEGDGTVVVKRAFPTYELRPQDPFVLLDEARVPSTSSFPNHPHRGFEIITYVLDGAGIHEDSEGNKKVIKAGWVQRITTGRGIWHGEAPHGDSGIHGMQLWINLPKKLKNIDPSYEIIEDKQLPTEKTPGYSLKNVVGNGSPVKLLTEVEYKHIIFHKDAVYTWRNPNNYKSVVYALEGIGLVNATTIKSGQIALMGETKNMQLKGEPSFSAIILAGKPWNEQMILKGPFVD